MKIYTKQQLTNISFFKMNKNKNMFDFTNISKGYENTTCCIFSRVYITSRRQCSTSFNFVLYFIVQRAITS